MKIIQTLWTKPGINGGWVDKHFHFFSWALSCLQLRKFYDSVELYTDELGKYLLIDTFKLPYTKVHLTLENFNYSSKLWSAPKILSYSMQEEPFLHVDGDIFIFSPFNQKRLDHGLVYQNNEIESGNNFFYKNIFKEILSLSEDKNKLPFWIQNVSLNNIEALNAGVFGGSDLSFFKTLKELAFDFFDNHSALINKMKDPSYATFIAEQALASILLKEQKISNMGLFSTNYVVGPFDLSQNNSEEYIEDLDAYSQWSSENQTHFHYFGLDHFGISPLGRQYVHLLGANKKSVFSSRLAAKRLLIDYPEYYHSIVAYFLSEDASNKINPDTFQVSTKEGSQTVEGNEFSTLRNKVNNISCRKIFNRTIFLYETITGRSLEIYDKVEVFIDDFENILEKIDVFDRTRLGDVFNLEKIRYYFAISSPSDDYLKYLENKSVESIKKIYDISQPDLDSLKIEINEFTRFASTKWNWVDHRSFGKESIPMCHKNILILIDITTKSLVEIELTKLNEIILYVLSTESTYSEVFDKALGMVLVEDLKEFKKHFFQCVVHLITVGALLIK